jgi:pyruvate dehydrogenase E1 component beta subunit
MSLSHGRREIVDLDATGAALGSARIARAGQDLTIVAYGSELPHVLRAAEQAAQEGVDAEVIDLRSLAPWDEGTVLDSVRRTGRLLTVHEAWKAFGHGAEVIARVTEVLGAEDRTVHVSRIGARPVPIPSGPLRKLALPAWQDIHTAILQSAGIAPRS